MKARKMTLTSEGTQAIPGGYPAIRPTSRDWVLFFSDLTFVNLTLCIETLDSSDVGYLEATHAV